MAGQADHPYSFTKTDPGGYRVDSRFSGGSDPVVQPGANIVQVGNVRAFEHEQRPRAGRIIIEPASHGSGRNSRATTGYVYAQRGVDSLFTGLVVRSYETR